MSFHILSQNIEIKVDTDIVIVQFMYKGTKHKNILFLLIKHIYAVKKILKRNILLNDVIPIETAIH